jgi:hypothetical protein
MLLVVNNHAGNPSIRAGDNFPLRKFREILKPLRVVALKKASGVYPASMRARINFFRYGQ